MSEICNTEVTNDHRGQAVRSNSLTAIYFMISKFWNLRIQVQSFLPYLQSYSSHIHQWRGVAVGCVVTSKREVPGFDYQALSMSVWVSDRSSGFI